MNGERTSSSLVSAGANIGATAVHPPAAAVKLAGWSQPVFKAWAFVVRDLRVETSYKFQFVWSFATVFFTVATFYFVAGLVRSGGPPAALAEYGGDYFAFVVIGIAIARYLDASLAGTTTAVRQAMNQGTLEIMFASPTRPMTVLAFSAIWQFLFETVRVLFCLATAAVFFGFRLSQPNWPAAAVALALTVPAFLSLGVLSASVLILLKRGDPLNWFAVSVASLLGGVLFPVGELPGWLQVAAYLVPLTHALDCFRGALLLGRGVWEMAESMVPLLVFSVLMLPIAWMVSGLVLRHARRSGALGTF
jgi:ABC-2 type transport system permease protein